MTTMASDAVHKMGETERGDKSVQLLVRTPLDTIICLQVNNLINYDKIRSLIADVIGTRSDNIQLSFLNKHKPCELQLWKDIGKDVLINASLVRGLLGGADKPPEPQPSTSTAHETETSTVNNNYVYFTNCSSVHNIMGAGVVNVTTQAAQPTQTDHNQFELPIKTDIGPLQNNVSEEIKTNVMSLVGQYHQTEKWAENHELCKKLCTLFQGYGGNPNRAGNGSIWIFVHFKSLADLQQLEESYKSGKLTKELSEVLILEELRLEAPCDLKAVVTIKEEDFQRGFDVLKQQGHSQVTESQPDQSIGTWVFESEFGQHGPGRVTDARGVTVSPINGDIAVADGMGPSVNVFNRNGEHKFNVNTKQGLKPGGRSCPHWVTVSSDGTYYVTDRTQFVKIFDKDGEYKGLIAAISPENHPSDADPTYVLGVDVDANDRLFIGEITQRYISIHHKDTSHINSIKVGIQPIHLHVTSQDTIIINSPIEGTSHIVDKSGQLLHILAPTEDIEWAPTGVCCYGNHIYVCNLSEGEIYCFSMSSGKYLGSIPTQIDRSRGIAMTEDGQRIFVSGRKAVQIFRQT